MKTAHEVLEVNREELQAVLEQARKEPLDEAGYEKLQALLRAFSYVADLIGEKDTTISQLRALLMKPSTEKTNKVLEQAGLKPGSKSHLPDSGGKAKPGHGRNGAEAYRGAERIHIPHASLKPGDCCPECLKGKVYAKKLPALRIRVVGQAPLRATVYELESLRCNLCGEVFEAEAPEGVGENKYDESAAAMIGLLKYGSGVPFYRLAGLEKNLGIPLPVSTQWEIVEEVAELIERSSSHERTGMFTSGIVSTRQGQRIALFFTGRRHAGENFAQVLAQRGAGLPPPIQMADGLSRNFPKLPDKLKVIVGNCNAHSRRRFVEVASNFPEECRYVLESLAEVYGYDAQAEERGLSAEERLRFHQEHSRPVMEKLHAWLRAQFAEKKVEPNSGLGSAITYCLKHWERLTLFLLQAGAPLDNNIVERALKKAVLHRKNSLFYKTENGAEVGDLFMSLIHTCELNGANPFDYLTELQKQAAEVAKDPSAWMPWNYRETPKQAAAALRRG